MPPATRSAANSRNDSDTGEDAAAPNAAEKRTRTAERATDEPAATAKRATGEAAAKTAAAGSGAAQSLRQILTMPATVARQVADDVVTTVRRPDAVLYLGGLVGLAVVGVLEWPVAAAAGVGVAVANGVRRARG